MSETIEIVLSDAFVTHAVVGNATASVRRLANRNISAGHGLRDGERQAQEYSQAVTLVALAALWFSFTGSLLLIAGLYQQPGRGPHATIRKMPVKITPLSNGPLRIEGEFAIYDAQGNPFGLAGRTAISLCRCGHSQNKPFCDGSHGRMGFEDACTARELPPPKPKL